MPEISESGYLFFLKYPSLKTAVLYDAKISERARRWPLTKTPLPFVRKRQMEDLFIQAGVNFTNVRKTFFVRTLFRQLFLVLALAKNSYEKRAHKMLMKLTTGVNFTIIVGFAL
jgi:hypothetical protein